VIETLPGGLQTVLGHSFGGRILLHAVEKLRPERARYVDPDFEEELPGEVIGTPILWARPMLVGGVGTVADACRWPVAIGQPAVPSSIVLSEVGLRAPSLSLLHRLELLGWTSGSCPASRTPCTWKTRRVSSALCAASCDARGQFRRMMRAAGGSC
jgi:hypothetical protein